MGAIRLSRRDVDPYALLGALLTIAAVMRGAPFWLDTLAKLARIRTTGAPPS